MLGSGGGPGRGGKGGHFHPCLVRGLVGRNNADAGQRRFGRQLNADVGDGQRMGKGVQIAGALGGHDPGKRTADLIPLCHPLPITKVSVELTPDASLPGIRIVATVKTTGQTGVEMEALTPASLTAPTIHDMSQAVDKAMAIGVTRVLLKAGGKSGRYAATLPAEYNL